MKVNDFFCGAGGMGLGFKKAGFEISGAWDFNKYAVESYKANVGDHVVQADVSEMTRKDVPFADVWAFGFPCQDLSLSGKRAGLLEGKRSKMFFEVMRLLDEAYSPPKIILAENVKGLKHYLPVLEEEYKKRNYKMYATLYNSKFEGVAQNRERYFVIGVHESIKKEFIFKEQQTENVPDIAVFLESDHNATPGAMRGRYNELGKVVQRIEPRKDRVSNTITTVSKDNILITNDGYRNYTLREKANLQGFPKDYKQVVSDTQFNKQIGNAVTVNVAQSVAEQIKSFLLSIKEPGKNE